MGTGSEVEEEMGQGTRGTPVGKPGLFLAQPQWAQSVFMLWEVYGSGIGFLL